MVNIYAIGVRRGSAYKSSDFACGPDAAFVCDLLSQMAVGSNSTGLSGGGGAKARQVGAEPCPVVAGGSGLEFPLGAAEHSAISNRSAFCRLDAFTVTALPPPVEKPPSTQPSPPRITPKGTAPPPRDPAAPKSAAASSPFQVRAPRPAATINDQLTCTLT
jgi:hypothetical protein